MCGCCLEKGVCVAVDCRQMDVVGGGGGEGGRGEGEGMRALGKRRRHRGGWVRRLTQFGVVVESIAIVYCCI